MKPLRSEIVKLPDRTGDRLKVGDIVTVKGQKYEAVLNTPQILSGQSSCIGCAFVAMGEYHTTCGWPPLTAKYFYCGGVKSRPENQILLRPVT